MEIYESIAWIALGFIPTLLVMETASCLARGFRLRQRKEKALTARMTGADRN
jgi:hypothetical protein